MSPRLEVEGVSKHFQGVHALREVSLAVATGRVLGLVGENGAGKSTLMKIMAGAEPRDSGEILLDGEPVRIASPQAAIDRGQWDEKVNPTPFRTDKTR